MAEMKKAAETLRGSRGLLGAYRGRVLPTTYEDYVRRRDPALTGLRKYRTFHTMESDIAVVATFLAQYEAALTQTGWHVDSDVEGENDRVRMLLGPLIEPASIMVLGQALTYGYALVEYAVGPTEAGVGVVATQRIPQYTIGEMHLDSQKRVSAFVQNLGIVSGITIPRDCVAYAVRGDSPVGEGLYANIGRDALYYLILQPLISHAAEANLRNHPDLLFPDNKEDEERAKEAIDVWMQAIQDKDARKHFELPSDHYEGTARVSDTRISSVPKYELKFRNAIDIGRSDMSGFYSDNMARVLGVDSLADRGSRQREPDTLMLAATKVTTLANNIRSGIQLVQQSLQEVVDYLYDINAFGEAPKIEADNANFISQLDLQRATAFLMEADWQALPSAVVAKVVAPAGITVEDLQTPPIGGPVDDDTTDTDEEEETDD